MLSLSLSTDGWLVSASVTGALHVKPPSVDRLARTAFGPKPLPVSGSTARTMTCAVPSGENETHGSLARWKLPPSHNTVPVMGTSCHVAPPLVLTPTTLPR